MSLKFNSRRKNQTARRGFVIIYVVVVMLVLLGFCSLAVDFGRVQVAKTELRRAADAAARAAAVDLGSNPSQAASDAVSLASQNIADNSPVTLNTSTDVQFLNWVSKSNYTIVSSPSSANAVRVYARRTTATGNPIPLLFAQILGVKSCDVTGEAVAMYSPGQGGLIGLNGVTMSGSGLVDSYNSSNGAYSSGTAGNSVSVESNAWIQLSGGAKVNGNAQPGAGYTVSMSGGSSVSNSTAPLGTALSEPAPTVPGSATTIAAININGSNTMTLNAGTYYTPSLTVSGSGILYINGPVTLYVGGQIAISGSAQVSGNLPGNFQINDTSSQNVDISGQSAFYGNIYAPLASVTISGQSGYYGAAVGGTLTISGSGGAHYDQSLGRPSISLVQ